MTHITRSPDGLLSATNPEAIRLLYLAPYAPDGPGYRVNAYTGDGGYPLYHFQIYSRLERLGYRVQSSSKPYAIVHAGGMTDYVFSLYNRMHFRNAEIFVPAHCEYLQIPYLGAGPNIRAVAEDKLLSKQIAQALGIPVPAGAVFHNCVTPTDTPPFAGPYFIKDRFGKGSEGITSDNLQADWQGAVRIIERLWDQGTDALVEEFVEGIDVTVPIVGDDTPRLLGVFHPPSNKPGNILTEDLKLTDPLGYQRYDAGETAELFARDMSLLWNFLGAMDYFRLDYRLNPRTGERKFLEFNICCYIGENGPFGLAAAASGLSSDALLGHIIAYSLTRQGQRRKGGRRKL